MSSRNVLLACTEAEIHKQTVFMSNLRAKRNSFLPISILPPETLAIIFIHGARHEYDEPFFDGLVGDIPTWVNVLYVCRHWRSVALNCPTLWTYPFHLSLRWTEELLRRSQQAPLKVSFICYYGALNESRLRWLGFLDKFLEHSERIQELRFHLFTFPDGLSLCAPSLERLEIKDWQYVHGPIVITGGDRPSLRTLKLMDCSMPWYLLNLSKLKSLCLCSVHSPSELGVAEFLSALRSMDCLTVLHLESALLGARSLLSSGGLGHSPKIDLPHLTRLELKAPLSTVVALLSCVNIPLKTQVSLVPHWEDGCSIDDYHPILSFIARRFSTSEERPSSDPTFRSLIIHPCELMFSTSRRDCKPRSHSTFEDWGYKAHDIPLEVIFKGIPQPIWGRVMLQESDVHRMMSNICCSIPSTDIQSLHIIQPGKFSSDFWREILGHLEGLRYMRLSDGNMPDLSLLSLRRKSDESPGGQVIPPQGPASGHMFVPALRDLKLHKIRFALDNMSHWELGISRKLLSRILSTRKQLRKRMKLVACEEC